MTKDEIIKAASNKLMGWKLPQDFCPDCYISFDSAKAKGMKSWPTGTNLLHVGQAIAMFEACIGEAIDAALASARLQERTENFRVAAEQISQSVAAARLQGAAERVEPATNEVQLEVIRYWPDGFQDRLEHVWKDLVGFIPSYKLYDLQRMLAEFGFAMKIYEGAAPASTVSDLLTVDDPLQGAAVSKPLTYEQIENIWLATQRPNYSFARAIESAIRGE